MPYTPNTFSDYAIQQDIRYIEQQRERAEEAMNMSYTTVYKPLQHEWDDDGCCIHCGFDGAEWSWWKRNTYEGRASDAKQPACKTLDTYASIGAG